MMITNKEPGSAPDETALPPQPPCSTCGGSRLVEAAFSSTSYGTAPCRACADISKTRKHDEEIPNLYARDVNEAVDAALDREGFANNPGATWWQVFDFLFDKDNKHEAALAQRYAVAHLTSNRQAETTSQRWARHMVEDQPNPAAIASLERGRKLLAELNEQGRLDVKTDPPTSSTT
jgi:hypothetical protein